MIIKIEDAPAVKHIKIDIDFTGDGEAVTTIVKDERTETSTQIPETKTPGLGSRDTSLNLDEDFTQAEEEEVQMPVIEEEEREVKIASEMNDMEI